MKMLATFCLIGIFIDSLRLIKAQSKLSGTTDGKWYGKQMTKMTSGADSKLNRFDVMPQMKYELVRRSAHEGPTMTAKETHYYSNGNSLSQIRPRKESKLVYGILNSKNDLKILEYEYLKPSGGASLKPRRATQLAFQPQIPIEHDQAKLVSNQQSTSHQPHGSNSNILEKTLSNLLDKNLQEAKDLLKKVYQITEKDEQKHHENQMEQRQTLNLAEILGRPFGYVGFPVYRHPNQLVTSYSQPMEIEDFDLYDEFDPSNWNNQISGDKNLGFEGGSEVDINQRMGDIFHELLAGGIGTPMVTNVSSLNNDLNLTAFEALLASNNPSDNPFIHPDPEDILKRHNWTAKHFMRREEDFEEPNETGYDYSYVEDNVENKMALAEEEEVAFLEDKIFERGISSEEDYNSELMLEFCRKGLSNAISSNKYVEKKSDGSKKNATTKEPLNKSLRTCLVSQAKEALSCHGNANPTIGEESCVFSSIAAFETQKNVDAGVPGVPSDMRQGLKPEVVDVACSGAFPVTCNASAPFRTLSGICNNPANVLWGAASTKLRRFVRNMYSDKLNLPRGKGKGKCLKRRNRARNVRRCSGNKDAILPDAAEISVGISRLMNRRRRNEKGIGVTSLFVYFAMFLHYDLSLVPEMIRDGDKSCCKNHNRPECFPITKGCRFKNRMGCVEFKRSIPFCGGEKGQKREQLNAQTAFIDLSNLYGNSARISEKLRLMNDGLLKTSNDGRNLPVHDKRSLAGDPRVTFAPGLTAIHTLFLREHNRVATKLYKLCCKGNDELLFQRARRIVIAEMQSIAYQSYLPVLLGNKEINKRGLNTINTTLYDPARKPNIRNAFATAASRYGHTLLNPTVDWESYVGEKTLGKLKSLLFDERVHRLGNGSGATFLINSMMQQRAQKFAYQPTGQDLVALSIQRGRDHGLPPYNHYRKYCKLPMLCSWGKRPPEINPDSWDMLSLLYRHPSDIDLYVGGILETPTKNGLLGKTFSCLLAEQFLNIMLGDRFFFTHRGPLIPYPFDDDQLNSIKKRKLSDLICDNTILAQVYENPFVATSDKVVCGQHWKLNMTLFSDEYERNKINSTASSLAF